MPSIAGLCLAAALCLIAAPALADDMPADTTAPAAAAELTADDLATLRGGAVGEQNVMTEQNLEAVNTGNTVQGNVISTGDVTLSSGALAGFNGVGNVVMNSGNNNNIQSTISVSIIMAPAAP